MAEKSFDFYIENKISQKKTLTSTELKQQFEAWLKEQDAEWAEYLMSDQVILIFLTGDKGLNATPEREQLPEIMKLLKPIYLNIVYPE